MILYDRTLDMFKSSSYAQLSTAIMPKILLPCPTILVHSPHIYNSRPHPFLLFSPHISPFAGANPPGLFCSLGIRARTRLKIVSYHRAVFHPESSIFFISHICKIGLHNSCNSVVGYEYIRFFI